MIEPSPLPWHVEITVDGDGVRVGFIMDAKGDMIAMVHPPLGGDSSQWKANLLHMVAAANKQAEGDT